VKPPGKAQKARRAYRWTGVYAVKARGLAAIDGRSAVGRQLNAWQAGVRADLGADLSAAEETLLALAVRDLAVVLTADGEIARLGDGIVTGRGRGRGFIQLVRDRQAAASALEARLRLLGLKRRPKPVRSLAEVIAAKAAERASASVSTRTPQGERAEGETASESSGPRIVDGRGAGGAA
jgi:hypothetical protein